jgi:hypothetical protein
MRKKRAFSHMAVHCTYYKFISILYVCMYRWDYDKIYNRGHCLQKYAIHLCTGWNKFEYLSKYISCKSSILRDLNKIQNVFLQQKLSSVCDDSCGQFFDDAKIRFVGPKLFYTISNDCKMKWMWQTNTLPTTTGGWLGFQTKITDRT